MTKITITVHDEDLKDNSYRVDFLAEGSQIEQGRATAAYFTGFYLHSLVSEEAFIRGAAEFGKQLVNSMMDSEGRSFPMPDEPATVRLFLEDTDLNKGRYQTNMEMLGGDPTGESLPTSAQVIALHMRNLLNNAEFHQACWGFAEEMIRDNDEAALVNPEFHPTTVAKKNAPIFTQDSE